MSQSEVEQHQPYIDFEEIISLKETGTHKVPIIRANEPNFSEYGRIVHDYDSEEIIIETWPAQGWRAVEPGTGNEGEPP